jgi:hypothetical protein
MWRAALFSGGIAVVAGCSSVPWVDYGEPPAACGDVFARTRLEWAGEGDPVGLGFYATAEGFEDMSPQVGDAYVGPVNPVRNLDWPSGRAFCVVYPAGVEIGPLPEGWSPP